MVLSIHCELAVSLSGLSIPLIERETAGLFYFEKIVKNVPGLKIVFEHASTAEPINFIINECDENVMMGLAPHHMIKTYKDVFNEKGNAIDPANLCLPVLKLEKDVKAVRKAIVSKKSFFGPDDAGHPIASKLGTNNPAFGIFNPAPVALPTVAEVMEEEGVLTPELYKEFTLTRASNFYELPAPPEGDTITLVKKTWPVPERFKAQYDSCEMIPFRHGEEITWQVELQT